MKFEYELNVKDVMESLYCMQVRTEKKGMKINVIILSMLGVYSIYKYCMDTTNIMAFFVSFIIVASLFMILYLPRIKCRRKAKDFVKRGNKCKVAFPMNDLKWAYESDRVITLQSEKEFYCIPKSALSVEQQDYIKNEVYSKAEKKYEIKF